MLVNNSLSKVFIFAAGAAIGSGVTWLLLKNKYERIAQEEIDKVMEELSNREIVPVESETVEDDDDEVEPKENPNIAEYENIVEEENYTSKKEEKNNMARIKVLEPDEFGDYDFPTVSLWYFEGDDVLTNQNFKMIKNADELVGEDFADHFGEYEDDSVFIRNYDLEVDYEILKDERSFSEIS